MSDSDEAQMSGDEEKDIKEEPHNDSEMGEIEDEENIMKILIATDIHLGYEQTTKRGILFVFFNKNLCYLTVCAYVIVFFSLNYNAYSYSARG